MLVVNHTTDYIAELYGSWKGVTDYENQAIYSVPFETTLLESKRLVVNKRTGFETHVFLEAPAGNFIIAIARCGEEILGKSWAVRVLNALR